MQTEWTLTIDLRQRPNGLHLEFNLLDRDRRHRWKDGCEIFADTFHGMVHDIATFGFDRRFGQETTRQKNVRQKNGISFYFSVLHFSVRWPKR